MSVPTGEQFEIAFGTANAVVTEVGASLRAFEMAGVPYVETYDAAQRPPLGCGAVLVPWPNRVAGARWTFDGEPQRLAVTEPARGNAIHGLLRRLPWRVAERQDDRITLTVDVEVQAGWPVPLKTTVGYALGEGGLTVTHTVRNMGAEPVPFGVGAHPYPRAGRSGRDDCSLQLAATTVLPLDPDTMVPTGPAVEVTGDLDFTEPRALAGAALDTAFGGCRPAADGLVHHRLTGPEGGVEVWADPDFRWVQVFTPNDFPNRGRAIAVEPMTCPPDALNSGIDLITLGRGETWSARWGIAPIASGDDKR